MKINKTVKEYYGNLDRFDNMDELAEGIAQHITYEADKDRVVLEDTGDFYEWLYEVYELPNHLQGLIPWDWDWFGQFTDGVFNVFFQSRLRETVVESTPLHNGMLNLMIVEDITDKAHQDGVGVIDTKEFYSWFNNEYEMSPEVEMMIPKNIKYDIRFYEVGVPEVVLYDNGVVLETLKSLGTGGGVDPEDLPRSLRRYAHMIEDYIYWPSENQYDIWLKEEYDNGNHGKQIFGYGVRDTARQLREDVIKLDLESMSNEELREYELHHLIDEDDEDEIGGSSLYQYRM